MLICNLMKVQKILNFLRKKRIFTPVGSKPYEKGDTQSFTPVKARDSMRF